MRWLLIVLGAVIFIAGIIFMLQGLGDIGGSAMSGKTTWAVLGPIIAVVGLVVATIGVRSSSHRPS